jgi:hypothetical protein
MTLRAVVLSGSCRQLPPYTVALRALQQYHCSTTAVFTQSLAGVSFESTCVWDILRTLSAVEALQG